MALTKEISYKHGVSENGELQTFEVLKVVKDGKVIEQTIGQSYSPSDPKDMSGFDQTSVDIADAVYAKTTTDALKAEQTTPKGTGLEEIVTHDRTIDDLGRISVRRVTRIFDEGVEISKKYHRSWVMPGDDTSKADVMSKVVADKLHTQAVIDAYDVKMSELSAVENPIVEEPK